MYYAKKKLCLINCKTFYAIQTLYKQTTPNFEGFYFQLEFIFCLNSIYDFSFYSLLYFLIVAEINDDHPV